MNGTESHLIWEKKKEESYERHQWLLGRMIVLKSEGGGIGINEMEGWPHIHFVLILFPSLSFGSTYEFAFICHFLPPFFSIVSLFWSLGQALELCMYIPITEFCTC